MYKKHQNDFLHQTVPTNNPLGREFPWATRPFPILFIG